jgi:hypothetical protein
MVIFIARFDYTIFHGKSVYVSWDNSLYMAIFNSYFDITRGFTASLAFHSRRKQRGSNIESIARHPGDPLADVNTSKVAGRRSSRSVVMVLQAKNMIPSGKLT